MKKTYFVVYDWTYNQPYREFKTLKEAKEYAKQIPEYKGYHIIEYDEHDAEIREIC